jgi:PEGA domain
VREKKIKLALLVAVSVGALAMTAAPTEAQRGRPGRGREGGRVVFVGGYYRPFFDMYPWYPYPFYPLQGPGLSPYGYYGPDPTTSVRLQVTPRETDVYVDGYLAGTVDNFDGFFQRLRLPPGAHAIVLYLDGYRTARQDLLLSPGGSFKIRHEMVPLAADETAEPRPSTATPPLQSPPSAGPTGPPPASALGFGMLAVRVQPADAEILVDGEHWRGPQGQVRLLLQVAEGTHQVEIRKEGYQSFATQVQTRAGETEDLNVSLPPLDRR